MFGWSEIKYGGIHFIYSSILCFIQFGVSAMKCDILNKIFKQWNEIYISFHFTSFSSVMLYSTSLNYVHQFKHSLSVMNLVVNKVWKAHESTDLEQKSVILLGSCQSPFLRQQRYLVSCVLSWSPTHDYERQILHLGCPISF